jgi:uncharacterized membrane protein YfhO
LVSRTSKVRTIVNVGDVEVGDEIEFVFKAKSNNSGTITLDVAKQKDELYAAGMNTLADEPWNLTKAEDTYLCGDISVIEDGFFYSSIPYEPGWTALVDGEEVPICEGYDPSLDDVLLKNAVISFPLAKGYHVIEMKYDAPGLGLGAVISLCSLVIFILLSVTLKKNPVLVPDVIKVPPVVVDDPVEEESTTEEVQEVTVLEDEDAIKKETDHG